MIAFHRKLPSGTLLTDVECCETGTGEGYTGIHGGRTGVRAADRVVAAVTVPPVGPGELAELLRRLLPTAPLQTPLPPLVPTEMEILLEHLLSGAPAPTPTPPPRIGITGMETLLQRLLPGMPVPV